MKDKTFLREQILGHLKLYSDLGVRYVSSPAGTSPTRSAQIRKAKQRGSTHAQNRHSVCCAQASG